MQLSPELAEPREGKVGIGMAAQPDSRIGPRRPDQRKQPHRVKSQAKSLISLREARSGLKMGLVAR
jgi:hypothetical protein